MNTREITSVSRLRGIVTMYGNKSPFGEDVFSIRTV